MASRPNASEGHSVVEIHQLSPYNLYIPSYIKPFSELLEQYEHGETHTLKIELDRV